MSDTTTTTGDCCVPIGLQMRKDSLLVPGSAGKPKDGVAPAPDHAVIVDVVAMPAKVVTMTGAQGAQIREVFTHREGAPNFAMRVFDVEPGGHTPYHHHNYEHEIFILAGSGNVVGAADTRPMKAGDAIFMPPNVPHQFVNTGNDTLRFICLIPHLL